MAYGFHDYGMPVSGFVSNYQNIGYSFMNNFRKQHVTSDRMIVWGAGVHNHDEFVDAVSPYFKHLDAAKGPARKASQYIGGEHREINESPATHVSLSFQGFSRKQSEAYVAYVLKYAFGVTGQTTQGRAFTHFHAKFPELLYIEPHHATFEDSGNFRIDFAAPNAKIGEICDQVVQELQGLAESLTEEEVARGRAFFYRDSFARLQSASARMIKTTKDFSQTGKIETLEEMGRKIHAVSLQSAKDAAGKILKSPVTLVVIGGNPHAVPSADAIQARLQ